VDVKERDALLTADPAALRGAGFDVPDGWGDCANPSPEWVSAVESILARDRQARAIRALRGLTPGDVADLLHAIEGARA
jgi:hypothetical protein